MPEKYIWANFTQSETPVLFEEEFFICDPTEVLKIAPK
jgi:hypothetical protein